MWTDVQLRKEFIAGRVGMGRMPVDGATCVRLGNCGTVTAGTQYTHMDTFSNVT